MASKDNRLEPTRSLRPPGGTAPLRSVTSPSGLDEARRFRSGCVCPGVAPDPKSHDRALLQPERRHTPDRLRPADAPAQADDGVRLTAVAGEAAEALERRGVEDRDELG